METKFKEGDRVNVRSLKEVYVVIELDRIRSRPGHPRYVVQSETENWNRTEAYEADMTLAPEPIPEPGLTLVPDPASEAQELSGDVPGYSAAMPAPEAPPEREPSEAELIEAPEPEAPLVFGRARRVRYVPTHFPRLEGIIYQGRFRAYEDIRLPDLPEGCPFEAVVTQETNGYAVWVSVVDDGGESFPCYLEEFYPTGPRYKTGAIELAVMLALGEVEPRRLPPSI